MAICRSCKKKLKEMKGMKLPRLNSSVWIIIYNNTYDGNPYSLSKQKVYMKNKSEFITEEAIDVSKIDECRIAYSAEDYGRFWFKSLKDAKTYLKTKWLDENSRCAISFEKLGTYFYSINVW